MAKATTSAEEKLKVQLLEGLRKGMDGAPRPLRSPANGPGLFPSAASGEKPASHAVERGFVKQIPAPEGAAKGRVKKPASYVFVTDRGRQYVLENDNPLKILEGLQISLESQGVELATRFANHQEVLQAIQGVLAHLARQPPTPQMSVAPAADWLDEVVRIVTEQKRVNAFERATLPRIYESLTKTRPRLTLGQFHDGLRSLVNQKRIRLTAYTQALATLPDAYNALFIDREVKYYVDLP